MVPGLLTGAARAGGLPELRLACYPVVVGVEALGIGGVGLGWNFSYVAATAALTDLVAPSERGRVLGLNDLLAGLLGAALALLGGIAFGAWGVVAVGVGGAALAFAPVVWVLRLSRHARVERPG